MRINDSYGIVHHKPRSTQDPVKFERAYGPAEGEEKTMDREYGVEDGSFTENSKSGEIAKSLQIDKSSGRLCRSPLTILSYPIP